MAKKHILHVKSNTVTNGNPKLPLPGDIEYGEIAINYADGHETISIKNSNDEIVTFPNMNIIHDNEEVIAQALANEERARIAADEALSSSLSALSDDVETLHVNDNLKEVTYLELTTMVNEATLVPGTFYRITDYNTVVNEVTGEYKSAGHQFDIIVHALSANTLSENASAISHEGETYFSEDTPFTSGDVCKMWELKYSLVYDGTKFDWLTTTPGPSVVQKTGVIYYMKDEWGNEAPYDFKNIMFSRKKVTAFNSVDDAYGTVAASVVFSGTNPYAFGYEYEDGSIFPYDSTFDNDDEWYYTFSGLKINTYTSQTLDKEYETLTAAQYAELNATEQGLYETADEISYTIKSDYLNLTDEGYSAISANLVHISYNPNLSVTDYTIYDMSTHPQNYNIEMIGKPNMFMKETCAGNVIKESWAYTEQDGLWIRKRYRLPNTVFVGFPNKIIETVNNGTTEYSWLNKKPCNIVSNTIGYGSYVNTFAGDIENNVFEENCAGNVLCENTSSNHFEAYCYKNLIGKNSYGNTFGYSSGDNYMGIACNHNTTGKEFRQNLISGSSEYNKFGNLFVQNRISGAFNNFGSYIYNNMFVCDYASFGNRISDSYFGAIDTSTTPYTAYKADFSDVRNNVYKVNVYGFSCTICDAVQRLTIPNMASYVTVLSGNYRDQNVSSQITLSVEYPQYVGHDSNGDVAIWCPADHLLPAQNNP